MKTSKRGFQMANLFKCFTCGMQVTSEEAKSHECEPMITKYVTIEASSFFVTKDEKGQDCLCIDGLNGTGYNFIKKKPNLVPLPDRESSDMTHHPNLNTEKNNGKHPDTEQIFMCARKITQVRIIGNIALRLRSYNML